MDSAARYLIKPASVSGKGAIRALAEVYKKLYLKPGMADLKEEYSAVALSGEEPSDKSLSHFVSGEGDSLTYEDTPAGEVLVLTLSERADFETFLYIMANKCEPYKIPESQGASILDGVVNWNKIHAHRVEFLLAEKQRGIGEPDWDKEFKRFTADKNNYKDAIIVLSAGPYSAVPAVETGLKEEEWLGLSHIIRKYHECTHFVMRRIYPEKKDAVWDELVADAIGLLAAFGRYDIHLAERFLGLTGGFYTGGRLINYIKDGGIGIEELSANVQKVMSAFAYILDQRPGIAPYEAAMLLEAEKEALYG